MTTHIPRRPRPRRALAAALSAVALATTGALVAPAAGATAPDDKFSTTFDRDSAVLDRDVASLSRGKVSDSLRTARGEVTAFVQLDADAAVDLAEEGRSRSAIRAQEREIEALADELVPQDASARSRSTAPRQLAVTSNLVAGVVVIGDAEEVRELAAEDDVVAVYRVIPKAPANKGTDSFTRAVDTWAAAGGATGAGVTVGIIDTGVDYTHATFGGPGTAEAYETAYGTDGTGPVPTELVDETKYLGGFDFAGPTYNAQTNPVPTPDENPIDPPSTSPNSGHGTHVAGTTAGYGVTAEGETFTGDYATITDLEDFEVGPGSAPEAGVYALKVFGDAGGSTGLVIQALEWAADPDGDGDFNDRIDILNLSLGSDGSPADDPENLFIDRLTRMGVLSVIASGNGGDVTDVGGSPGNSNSALTVANSVGGSQSFDAVEVTAAPDASLVGTYSAQSSVNYTGEDDAAGEVVAISETFNGCEPFTAEQSAAVTGKIAYLYWNDQDPSLDCGSAVRFDNAEAAGAIGVLLSSQTAVFSAGIAGNTTIPGAQLTATSTTTLQDAILAGGVEVVIGPSLAGAGFEVNPVLGDLVNPGSSRGVHGSLGVVKPDVAAPGTNIASAASGGGTAASILSGTSMATPHVAGIAALVSQAHPDWTPEQVKAAVMNTATHDLFTEPGQSGLAYGPERVGSGRVDALAAVQTETLAYASDNPAGVSLSFGVVEVGADTVTLRETVTVRNLASSAQTYSTAFVGATPGDEAVTVRPASVRVPAGQTRLVTVEVTLDPATLQRVPDPTQDPLVNVIGPLPRDFVSSIAGWLEVTPDGADALRVPVQVAPRPVTDLSGSDVDLGTADSAPLTLSGRDVFNPGWIGLTAPLVLTATSPRLERSGAVTSDSVIASGDLRYVGFSSDVPTVLADGGALTDAIIGVGLATDGDWATLGSAMIPLVATDIDGDGAWDLETAVIKGDPAQDSLFALTFAVTGEDPATGELQWGDLLDFYPISWGSNVDFGVFDNNQVVIPFSPGWVGITEGDVPTFRVQTFSPYADAENGIIDEVSFTADPFAPAYVFTGNHAVPTHVLGESGGVIEVHRTENTPTEGQILLLHTLNAAGERAQVVDVTAQPVEEPGDLVESTTELKIVPSKARFGSKVTAKVTVSAEGADPTGTVVLTAGDRVLGEVELPAPRGKAGKPKGKSTVKLELPRDLPVGRHVVTASYSGDEAVAPSSDTEVLKVTKGKAKVKAKAGKKGSRATLAITVTGPKGAPTPTGKVVVKVGKAKLRATLEDGRAAVTLPRLKRSTKVKVTYAGTSSTYGKASTTVKVKEVPKKAPKKAPKKGKR